MTRRFFLAALFAFLALAPLSAHAGQPVLQAFTCQHGAVLADLEGRNGDWVDLIEPICRPWDGQRLGGTMGEPRFGNTNGGVEAPMAMCANGAAMFAVDYDVVSPNGPPGHVRNLSFRCANLPYLDGVRDVGFAGGSGGHIHQICTNGTIANGLVIGLDGVNITSLQVRCDTLQHIHPPPSFLNHRPLGSLLKP